MQGGRGARGGGAWCPFDVPEKWSVACGMQSKQSSVWGAASLWIPFTHLKRLKCAEGYQTTTRPTQVGSFSTGESAGDWVAKPFQRFPFLSKVTDMMMGLLENPPCLFIPARYYFKRPSPPKTNQRQTSVLISGFKANGWHQKNKKRTRSLC